MHLFSHKLAVKATKVSSGLNLYKDENNYSLIKDRNSKDFVSAFSSCNVDLRLTNNAFKTEFKFLFHLRIEYPQQFLFLMHKRLMNHVLRKSL